MKSSRLAASVSAVAGYVGSASGSNRGTSANDSPGRMTCNTSIRPDSLSR